MRIAEQLLVQYQDNQKEFEEILLFLVNHLNQGYEGEIERDRK
jgi:hypothetical protein